MEIRIRTEEGNLKAVIQNDSARREKVLALKGKTLDIDGKKIKILDVQKIGGEDEDSGNLRQQG